MLCKRKPSSVRRRVRKYICIILAVIIILTSYFELAVRVELGAVIRAQMKIAAQTAINSAVSDFLAENPDAGKRLSALDHTDSGTVSSITTDPSYINYMKSDISLRTQRYIDSLSREKGLSIPVGSFTGLVIFSNLGPEVSLPVDSRTVVTCKLESTFDSAGINQTVHHISLKVNADIAVYNPFRIYNSIKTSSDFEISQTVISGAVPNYGGIVTY